MKAVFKSPETSTTTKWALASYALHDAFTDFILPALQSMPASSQCLMTAEPHHLGMEGGQR